MQLKSVKLVGFKSFVDPTTIHIQTGMNGVVGPNGCGKSNIIDAVRWVIGERSAKQLRGQSMADVIFNGTSGRKPVGRASVELLFDNSDGTVVGEYAGFSEIAVKREVFREGQSNYYLNGTACRRQDIVDIFYGTGLGSRSYAIIEQGMISRLIEAKPEDLRNHIEEAAGIAKYKQRRRDTENRIKRTHENLSRLMDIRDELDKQLRHLQRQATAAERYKALREEERRVNAEIKALHWQKLQKELERFQEKIATHHNERERVNAQLRHAETEIEKSRLEHTDATDKHNQAQKAFYSMGSQITELEQKIKYTQDQLQRWQSDLETTTSRWEELSESASDYEIQIEEITNEIESLRPRANNLLDAYRQAQEVLQVAERDMQAWNERWEQHQNRFAESRKLLEVNRTKVNHYQQQQQQLNERITRLKDNRNEAQQQTLQSEIEPLSDQLIEYQQAKQQSQLVLDDVLEKLHDKKRHSDALQKLIRDKHAHVQTKEGRKASLEALQEAAYASNDEAVQQWLQEQGLSDYPRLGKDLQVTQGWEVAVETILKGLFDAVCIDELDTFIDGFAPLESGELVLVEKGHQSEQGYHDLTSLSSLVKSEWPVSEWLGNVFVADDLTEAKQLRRRLHEHQSVVTRDGVWLGKHWLRMAKTINSGNSVLLRDQELKALIEEILHLKNELLGLESDQEQTQHELTTLEARREQLHKEIQTEQQQISQVQSQLAEKQARYESLVQRAQAIREELNECYQRESRLSQELREAETIVQQQSSEVQQFESQQQALSAEKQQHITCLNEKRERAQQAKQAADEYDIRLSSNENQLRVLQQTLSRDKRQLEQLTERRDTLQENLSEADNPLATLREQLQQQLNEQSRCELILQQAAEALEGFNRQTQAFERTKDDCQQQLNQMQSVEQQLQMDQQAVRVRQTTICEQLQEAELGLEALLEQLPENAQLQEWDERSEKLASRITRLGPINLAAIEEHDMLVERKEYIDKQHADLEEALNVLENAIRKIDKETRSKFKATFDKVNEGFSSLFPKVFGGGQASLEMDNEDFLTAGVIVKAQPPGKRNATIHMLSGGEKALTAIALVFGLFHLNPAPFCILDEVDAPLDDLNVGRYCRLISEMAHQIQFIVISHNKVTIEHCDRLLGITMQEPGVSRLVSVDIEEAVSLAEA